MAIIFEGDFVRVDGVISEVVDFSNRDRDGSADCILANGYVVNSEEVEDEDVFLASEII